MVTWPSKWKEAPPALHVHCRTLFFVGITTRTWPLLQVPFGMAGCTSYNQEMLTHSQGQVGLTLLGGFNPFQNICSSLDHPNIGGKLIQKSVKPAMRLSDVKGVSHHQKKQKKGAVFQHHSTQPEKWIRKSSVNRGCSTQFLFTKKRNTVCLQVFVSWISTIPAAVKPFKATTSPSKLSACFAFFLTMLLLVCSMSMALTRYNWRSHSWPIMDTIPNNKELHRNCSAEKIKIKTRYLSPWQMFFASFQLHHLVGASTVPQWHHHCRPHRWCRTSPRPGNCIARNCHVPSSNLPWTTLITWGG